MKKKTVKKAAKKSYKLVDIKVEPESPKEIKLSKKATLCVREFGGERFFFIATSYGEVVLKEETASNLNQSLRGFFK